MAKTKKVVEKKVSSTKKDSSGFEVSYKQKTNNEVLAEMNKLREVIESSDDEGLKHYGERHILSWLDMYDAKHKVHANQNFLHNAVSHYNFFVKQQNEKQDILEH